MCLLTRKALLEKESRGQKKRRWVMFTWPTGPRGVRCMGALLVPPLSASASPPALVCCMSVDLCMLCCALGVGGLAHVHVPGDGHHVGEEHLTRHHSQGPHQTQTDRNYR